ncbi:flagellar biosynthesis chaperone [Bacillus methanolicus PB1]|uniref:Flagellar FliJ protein n=1 Tax=Bacillus methanolicus PB1 TaxID=997296 RepID=I3E4S7_BACMT|nr:flagellar export protein FliJ [Bacillus methanolicus]EIJ81498.1 flagellar biosynthesis chaperone [Bacillus methanolicus PB1]
MRYHYKFEKILSLKEREKDEALNIYNESVKKFEEAAEKLYELMKKKEDLEAYQFSRLVSGLSVQEIRHHQQFIGNLEKSIEYYQKMVMNARNRMYFYQEKLLEKNIEVKKFKRIKEKDFLHYIEEQIYSEGKQMDDISIKQFMNREN